MKRQCSHYFIVHQFIIKMLFGVQLDQCTYALWVLILQDVLGNEIHTLYILCIQQVPNITTTFRPLVETHDL